MTILSARLTRASSQWLSGTPWNYNADYAVGGWFKVKQIFIWHGLVSIFGPAAGGDDGANSDRLMVYNVNNRIYLTRSIAGAYTELLCPTVLADNTAYYVKLVAAGTALRLYLGTTPSNIALEGSITADPAGRAAATAFRIGNSPYDDFANGEFGGWRSRLASETLAEVKAEAARPVAVDTDDLHGDWPLPDHTFVSDISDAGHDLTIHGGPLTDGAAPPYVYTTSNRTMSFAGAGAVAFNPRHDRPRSNLVPVAGFKNRSFRGRGR